MQTFLKVVAVITIFFGIIAGIYVIADSLSIYTALKQSQSPFEEQIYLIKIVAGGAIILSSVVSGMLYLSFGIVIELLDHINEQIFRFLETMKKNRESVEEYEF